MTQGELLELFGTCEWCKRLHSEGFGLGHSASDQVNTRQADLVTRPVAKSPLTNAQVQIVDACETPQSLAERMDRVAGAHRTQFQRPHVRLLLDAGIGRMTNPDRPRAANPRYLVTEASAALRAERLRRAENTGP